jgi:hypothetical protein
MKLIELLKISTCNMMWKGDVDMYTNAYAYCNMMWKGDADMYTNA